MRYAPTSHDRRRFLRLAAGLAASSLLSGCGGESASAADGTPAPTPAPAASVPVAAPTLSDSAQGLNLALNLGYVGALYYGTAARGAGLADSAITGVGTPGRGYGARQVSFTDATIARHAGEFADDKTAQVLALRTQLGAQAAAQPAIDLSAAGAFTTAAQRAGIVDAGASFDPYVSDAAFLTGAFLIENRVAAAYRSLLRADGDAASSSLIAANLADAIYHGGVIRSLLEDRAPSDPVAAAALAKVGTFLATLDGSDVGDQSLEGASGPSVDIVDAEGHPIPFTRDSAQVLKTLYLTSSGVGGFLPGGANGVHA